jgi:uncharacterized protein (TIGR04255 family)
MERLGGERLQTDWMGGLLPEYKNAPVVETALAVEFAQLQGWSIVHYGILWERFRSQYPNFEVHPHILFSGAPAEYTLQDPPLRCFFLDAEGTQLVQVRSGAFVRNWRARPSNNSYPRYATIRPSFERDFEIFDQFLRDFKIPPIEAWKCEVTYINHFVQGREWSDPFSLCRIMPILSPEKVSGLLSEMAHARFVFGYQLPEDTGTLQMELVPVISPEGRQIMQLGITAVGRPRGNDLESILDWLDKGHYAVVKGFSDFTSKEAQTEYWGREWL